MRLNVAKARVRCLGCMQLSLVLGLSTTLGFAQDEARTQKIGNITFTLADNLRIEQAADESLVTWPIVADWDAQGRLVVIESGGVEKPIVEHNLKLLHKIVRLVDEDGDGRFDKRILAADQLPFAEGVLCLDDYMLVSAPPTIWKLTDQDGDGYCERREVWFDGQTITGCANDLHGPYLGRDGWIYWCKGAFAEQTHELTSGKVLKDKASHVFRRRIEGGPIESLISGGMDNPVEFAFTPEGEKFFTSTFLQNPGNGLRDGIAHAIYGGVHGKQQQALEGLVRTGPLMPIMTQLGPAAPSGLTCLESSSQIIPDDARGENILVAALFNLQKVTAHRLRPMGASFITENRDLLVADRVDFHPTDILEDAQGGLLVIDTGGWYDLCCPTSRVDQKVAAGGIYRLQRIPDKDSESTVLDPKLQASVAWDKLTSVQCVSYLTDPRPWIGRRARQQLRRLGDVTVEPLTAVINDASRQLSQRLDALWALSFVGTDKAISIASSFLGSDQASLVQAACHVVSLHRFKPAIGQLEKLVVSKSPALARTAAEALGRLSGENSTAAIMHACRDRSEDNLLDHSMLYALIELEDLNALAGFLNSPHTNQRRLAILALQQLKDEQHLDHAVAIQAATSDDSQLRAAGIDILAIHPQWAADSIADVEQLWLASQANPAEGMLKLVPILRAWRDDPAIQARVAQWMSSSANDYNDMHLNEVLACWEHTAFPEALVAALRQKLASSPALLVQQLASLDLRPAHCRPLVEEIHSQLASCRDPQLARELLRALPVGEKLQTHALVESLIENREIDLLAHIRVSREQAFHLVTLLPEVTSQQLPLLIEAINAAQDDEADIEMLTQLQQLPTARTLSENFLANLYRNRDAFLQKLEKTISLELARPSGDVEAKVQAMLGKLTSGDPVRGLQVFRSAKASCSACHQLGYVGGNIGPELSRIGRSRTREALLEAILLPNARIEQSYQATKLLTHDGKVYNGLIRRHLDQSIELQLTADRSILLELKDIERQEPSSVSIMPAGITEGLTEQDIADLLSLLESAK